VQVAGFAAGPPSAAAIHALALALVLLGGDRRGRW
jgi:hypothetical protein